MARGEMLTVFAYDISKDKKRRKAAKILEAAASRVQFSVFECRMTRQRAAAVAQRVSALLDAGDSLRVYAVGADGLARSRVYGDGVPMEEDAGFWVV
ncbi:CRISPR-associated endonuclease Cas2 [Thalassococcus profundi]|uniref:CRISPR-associated endoribonuclease Cas2 n=1 Tax=Thalassococcus profundi TaxID=2282382 RepID=A0A369TR15_9RHOB|nr:CRISPR-associated endonuclease Cas2 [Thalassococcus profundi]RDD67174.1 CRISPR-associated endonuclease Cas2 [Thalassococcus profundi]